MITKISENIFEWMGWCPNAPAMRTAPAVLVVPSVTVNSAQPSGGAGGSGRIRRGICIATGSIKTLVREKHLFWFSFLAALVILFLITVEEWTVAHIQSSLPFLIDLPISDSFLPHLYFDTRLFLVELICLFCLTILLAGLITYRSGNRTQKSLTIQEAFARISTHAGPLVALSIAMALSGVFLYEIISQSQFFGKIIYTIDMAVFYLPYAYYFPNSLTGALYISFQIMFINIFLFLLVLYVIPVIVLEKKGLVPSLAGSFRLMKKTWQEMLGCVLVFGAIVLGVAAIALVIGQSPLLLNHDYDFFLQMSRGQVLMTVACYGFIFVCGVLMAVGSTVLGIAITNLYSCGRPDIVHPVPESELAAVAQPIQ
jgi:hypothetical protein